MQFALLLPNIPHASDGQANTQSMLPSVCAADARTEKRAARTSLWTSIKPFVPFAR
jgi:hypothetical protein